MDILVIQPGFPAEIPYFVRGLKRMGARVLGVGDTPKGSLPEIAKQGLDAYLQVPNMWHAPSLIRALRQWNLPIKLDRVECLWEAAMELTAEVREAFNLPGLTPYQTQLFRDKHLMRSVLDKAGVRNPRHMSARTDKEILEAAQHTGFPLIVKPIAGAGSANTFRANNMTELKDTLPLLRGVTEVVVEEFVHGTEYTFDTICIDGKIAFYNVELYRPDMLSARSVERISPQTIVVRDLNRPEFKKAHDMAQQVVSALGYTTGFTHMEWFLKPDGDVVFGEIAGRPPGGNSGQMMNYCHDFDVYNAWAEALIDGKISQRVERKYNVGMIFKRAHGQGRIRKIEGLREVHQKFGDLIMDEQLLPIGARRRNWKQTLLSDGYLTFRHPNMATTLQMADFIDKHLNLYAG